MKKISKEPSPEWFETWKHEFQSTNGRRADYKNDFAVDDSDGRARRRRLRENLIKEQGQICCYCMKRIFLDNSHIEHFRPKIHFPNKDLEYDNLFASCNGAGTIYLDEHCGHKKEEWWAQELIPPTDNEVENIFKYSIDGKIHSTPKRPTTRIAQEMIKNMGLDSFHLERERRQAIEASEVFDEEVYSEDDIRSFIDYYSNKDDGVYVPYCGAIIDCLKDMLA